MAIIKLIIYFLSIILPGYLILLLTSKQEIKSIFFKLALAYGLGAYFITIQLFIWFFLCRFAFSSWFYLILTAELILLAVAVQKRGLLKLSSNIDIKLRNKLKVSELVIILLIIIQLIFLFSNALSRPVVTFDSLAHWSFKAKVLYYENRVDFNPESNIYLVGGGHINYPWLVPLMQFWLHNILGEYNDLLINLIFVFYFISILVIVYYFIKEYLSRFYSMLFVFFLSSMPLFFYHGFNAYADQVLSCYILTGFIFLYYWFKQLDNKSLILSSIFFSIALFVKNEAIIFIITGLVAIVFYLLIKKIKIKILFYYIVFVLLPVTPWLIFKLIHDLGVNSIESNNIGFHPEVFKFIAQAMFIAGSWNIWWFIVVITIILNFKYIIKNKTLLSGWLFLLISFSGFIILYLFTDQYHFVIDNTAVSRNILTLIPVSVAIVAITFSEKFKTE